IWPAIEVRIDVHLGDLPTDIEVTPGVGTPVAVPVDDAHRLRERPDLDRGERHARQDAQNSGETDGEVLHGIMLQNTSQPALPATKAPRGGLGGLRTFYMPAVSTTALAEPVELPNTSWKATERYQLVTER